MCKRAYNTIKQENVAMYKTLFQNIDKLSKKYIDFLIDICNIESPTNCKEGVDAVGNLCIQQAKLNGWKVEILEQKVSGNCICITMNDEVDERPISFSAHMDTVHPVGSFGTPAARCEGDIIYGPGTADCKGGIAVAFLAMEALKNSGFKSRPVQLLLQSDEENSSKTSNKETIRYICEKAKDSVAFLNCEVQMGDTAVLKRKGILRYIFKITGEAAHSSTCFDGANAILEASHKIIELEKFKDKEGITCNCGCINGGTVPNSVAEECSFTADIRYFTAEEYEYIKNKANEIAKNSYIGNTTCELSVTSERVAMYHTEKNIELLKKMNKIYSECGLNQLQERISFGGSDACDVTAFGIPCVDSIGIKGDFIHSHKEFAYASSLSESAKRIAAVAYGIDG